MVLSRNTASPLFKKDGDVIEFFLFIFSAFLDFAQSPSLSNEVAVFDFSETRPLFWNFLVTGGWQPSSQNIGNDKVT